MEPETPLESGAPEQVLPAEASLESAVSPEPALSPEPAEPMRMPTMGDLDRLASDLDAIDSTLAELDAT